MNQSQRQQIQIQLPQTHSNKNNQTCNHTIHTRPSMTDYQSYSSFNDDTDDSPIVATVTDDNIQQFTPLNNNINNNINNKPVKQRIDNNDFDFGEYYYNELEIDMNNMSNEYNHSFKCMIESKLLKKTITIQYSLLEFILSYQSLNISTINAVWQKIPKNGDELIGNKQNLCLCIHILICICIKNKYKVITDKVFFFWKHFSNCKKMGMKHLIFIDRHP